MKRICIVIFFATILSCKKEALLLPLSNKTILSDIKDHSPVYLFFRIKNKDTLVEVNKKNTISSTNWVFNIDKRLPLKLVIPEIKKLKEKKNKSSHKKEGAIDVFTYSDSIKKKLAFMPFTNVVYKFNNQFSRFYIVENNKVYLQFQNFSINFNKNNEITVDGNPIERDEFVFFVNDYVPFVSQDKLALLHLNFDQNLTHNQYILNKILVNETLSKQIKLSPIEFVYDTKKLPKCGCKL